MHSEDDRKRLFDAIYQMLDDGNACDLETFARQILHNGGMWDSLADAFPTASASVMRTVMMEAFTAWQQSRS
jgi:hypothetical protein